MGTDDGPKTPKADALAAKVRRARQRADRLPRRRYEADGMRLDLAEREKRLAALEDTGRAAELANRVKPSGGGPQ